MGLALTLGLAAIIVIDLIRGGAQPGSWLRARHLGALVWAGMVVGLILLSRSGITSWLVGALAALPVLWLAWAPRGRDPQRRLLLAGGFFAVGMVFVGLATTLPSVRLHEDSHPLMLLAGGLLAACVMAIVSPPERLAGGGWIVAGVPVVFVLGWVLLVVWIGAAAARVYPDRPICFAAPGQEQVAHARALSPRAVLFSTGYRGATRARLLIGAQDGPFTHHLSLRRLDFLPNKSQAFGFMAPRHANCRASLVTETARD